MSGAHHDRPEAQATGGTGGTVELSIVGMDCADCVRHVQHALLGVKGVRSAEVWLASERARVELETGSALDRHDLRDAVRGAGYDLAGEDAPAHRRDGLARRARQAWTLLGLALGAVLFLTVLAEGFGLFGAVTRRVPPWLGIALVVVFGAPAFLNVARAAMRGRVVSHTLMALGAAAALAVGAWPTAAVVVLFMHLGTALERATADRARGALRDLGRLAPDRARVIRPGGEVELDIAEVRVGDTVVVRPGERVPVDGLVVAGRASVDASSLTGEPLPLEAEPGTRVLAASLVHLGSLRVRADAVGRASTVGRMLGWVERAEGRAGPVQRAADRFSSRYLPVVAGVALATWVLRGDLMAAVAVTVVACSCAFALATPVALMATVGAAARRGILVKGTRSIERLAAADVWLFDKTGTLTVGRPEVRTLRSVADMGVERWLTLAACAEHDSEHPVGRALVSEARARGHATRPPEAFEAAPGTGVRATVGGHAVTVGRWDPTRHPHIEPPAGPETPGTCVVVEVDGAAVGLIELADRLRPEAVRAVAALRAGGAAELVVLTGDRPEAARNVAARLGISARGNLLPDAKAAAVAEFQAAGHTVVMVGDGVNDAAALATADVGVAMGVAGSELAWEAGDVALLREDLMRLPELAARSRHAMRVVRGNLWFTAGYNVLGLTLAALGVLPPFLAASLQVVPDVGIMANSGRLLRPVRPAPPLTRAAVPASAAEREPP